MARVRENTERLGLSPELITLDATDAGALLAGRQFDAILADVPCSATGVIRRNPDVKLLRHAGDPDQFAQQQQAILSGLWPLLKEGGRLLYVTCSILQQENDDRIAHALQALPGAQLQPLPSQWGVPTQFGIQRLPAMTGGDGLYFSMLRKVKSGD